jgi:L,D-peptidoglycan transpeptidase YkuD (ErfK/YbiS/YcfS/YnhG family)
MKQMRSIGLAVLVTLMLLSMPGKAGHAKETPSPEWVTALPAAAKTEQLIVVGGVGKTTAWISMHEKEKDGRWHQIMTTPGFIGREGLGKEKEGDWKSPAGTFRFNKAFGIAPDPGCAIPYTQVDKNT